MNHNVFGMIRCHEPLEFRISFIHYQHLCTFCNVCVCWFIYDARNFFFFLMLPNALTIVTYKNEKVSC